MPTVLQFRRGTTAQNNSFTGSAGELSIDTDLEVIRVHDGSHPGGYPLVGVSATQTLTNKTLSSPILSGTASGTVDINITGTITASGAVSLASITKTGGNGVGNIGQSDNSFNTVFAKATSAQYADLAECYAADQNYTVGTVLVIGGDQEVTQSTVKFDSAVIGSVSDKPAYIMNDGITADHVATIALTGRVPVRVVGKIAKGSLLVTSDIPGVATAVDAANWQPGCVFAKALEAYDSEVEGVIEAVVGRF